MEPSPNSTLFRRRFAMARQVFRPYHPKPSSAFSRQAGFGATSPPSLHFGETRRRNMNTPSSTPGICRIDQPAKHNHGFFVRLQRKGKIHSAFFTDCSHGGRKQALAAAQQHRRKLLAKLGPPKQMLRRWWAEIRRRKSSSGIVGVQKLVDRRSTRPRTYWKATWSPKPYVVRRKWFSVRKFGARKARRLAIRARRAGVRNM